MIKTLISRLVKTEKGRSHLRFILKIPAYLRRIHRHQRGVCSVCGKRSLFLAASDNLKESLGCLWCHAILRKRYLANRVVHIFARHDSQSLHVLVREEEFRDLSILLAEAHGPLFYELQYLPNFTASEYLDDMEPGDVRDGIRCEDLSNLSFEDEAFDILMHTSVFEHVREPLAAINESYRVLKPNGIFLLEVPLTTHNIPGLREVTTPRVDVTDSEDKHILPPVYHGDPLRSEGALVYNDFGMDLQSMLSDAGFTVYPHILSIEHSSMSHCVVFECQKKA